MTVAAVRFMSELDTRAAGNGEWVLLSDFQAKVFMADGDEEWITVPKGFVTDLASVPRLPLMHWFFGGRARRSAVLHDYLYVERRQRSFADEVFFVSMRNEEGPLVRFAMYMGVRLGGWTAYVNKQKEDNPWRDA
jgi:hypothetical protein